MSVRFARLAPRAAFAVLILLSASPTLPAQTREPLPPPMFSPWYAESLRDVLIWEESDVARLERRLRANPEDFPTRLKLMAYHARADRAGRPADLAKRIGHALWLIEHHPDSEILHSFVSQFSPAELPPAADYRRAVALWDAAARAKPRDAAVQWNAASFFDGLDAELHLHYLELTAAADPNHPYALRPLAHLYAVSILERSPLAPCAQAGLDASKNVQVLANAANMFQNLYNQSLQRGIPNPRAAELAERYFLRAKALHPRIDRRAILPQIEREVASTQPAESQNRGNGQALGEDALGKVRRLPTGAFPELPPTVARILRARSCSVPQPAAHGAPRNAIRGEFIAKGESGWAVLCSVNNSTALLVFRNAHDPSPQTVATSDDGIYLQDLGSDHVGYSREITAAGRDFILRHYRAYGGPEPPPIDHQGIDDAFLEKASITWYFHKGQWLQLTGSD